MINLRNYPNPSRQELQAFGVFTFLAQHSDYWWQKAIWELELNFFPPINLNQYRIFRDDQGIPRGAVTWAYLDQATARKWYQDQTSPEPADWNSGEDLWFTHFIAPFGHGLSIKRHIVRNTPGQKFRYVAPSRVGLDKITEYDFTAPGKPRVRAVSVDDL